MYLRSEPHLFHSLIEDATVVDCLMEHHVGSVLRVFLPVLAAGQVPGGGGVAGGAYRRDRPRRRGPRPRPASHAHSAQAKHLLK